MMESAQKKESSADLNDYDAEDQDSEDFKRTRSKSSEDNKRKSDSITEEELESGELGEIFEAGEIPSSPIKEPKSLYFAFNSH
jgi:hypothetical protein